MVLTQKNYRQLLSKELLKQAEKVYVRESDEVERGRFQAYIDEKENSFDVSIIINKDGEIVEHSCDCNSRVAFCRHKTALLISLGKEKGNDRQQIKNSKKNNAFDVLLEEVDTDTLKDWIRSQLSKNKELELAFLHQFSNRQKVYEPADVKQLTLNAVKAVVGNRKKLEVSEAKKIVELWTEIHEPVIDKYLAHVSDDKSFQNFFALTESCNEVTISVNATGAKLDKYLADVLLRIVGVLHELQDENAWDIATGYFAERINDAHFVLRTHCLAFLSRLHDLSNKERRERLTHQLVAQYSRIKSKEIHRMEGYTYSMLTLVKNSRLFDKYYKLFKPIQFLKEYNDELIRLLIECDHLEVAEKFCLDQIGDNYRQDYSFSYFEHLKEIYSIRKNNPKLIEVLKILIPQTFNFVDFITVYEQMEGDEKKKWRTKILTRAGHMGSYNLPAHLFSFSLTDYEQNYKKMIDYIGERTPYSVIVQYGGKMAMVNKDGFIKQLLKKYDNNWFGNRHESEETGELEQIWDILQKHYKISELELVLRHHEKSNFYYRRNSFIEFMKKKLA